MAELFDKNLDQWDAQQITEVMGRDALQGILQVTKKPANHSILSDRLIWLPSKTGTYTAKQGYEMLRKLHRTPPVYAVPMKEALTKIWEWKGLIPRVRTFLWRAIHGGLPTTAMLHTRIRRIDPICSRCHIENEFLMHMFFFCPMARAT